MTHGPYVKLIAGFLFTSLAFMVSWGPNLGGVSRWDKAWDTGGVSGLSKVPWNAGMSPGGGIPISPLFLFPSSLLSHPQLVEGNFALFCTYTLDFRNEFQNLLLAIMVRVGSGLKGFRGKTG